MKDSLYTIWVFTKVSTKRFFRDKVAIFFTVIFPLIFLFAFGGLFGSESSPEFSVAVFNHAESKIARQFVSSLQKSSIFKIEKEIKTISKAKKRMSRSRLDAVIKLPKNFGRVSPGARFPSGTAIIIYSKNNKTGAQIMASILKARLKKINAHFVKVQPPFTVNLQALNVRGLSRFDYIFAGLLGFAIIGMGVFGPVNVFPELKKQGILRRLHTTPLKVWQYFVSTAFSQAAIGLVALAVFFAVGIFIFGLNVVGSIFVLVPFLIFSIISILGIGLAIGGWADNQSQAAPVANIIVFPMLILSGSFFPRFLMPDWIQTFAKYLPLTPVIDGARMIITQAAGFTELGPQLLLLTIWTVVVYGLAFHLFQWE